MCLNLHDAAREAPQKSPSAMVVLFARAPERPTERHLCISPGDVAQKITVAFCGPLRGCMPPRKMGRTSESLFSQGRVSIFPHRSFGGCSCHYTSHAVKQELTLFNPALGLWVLGQKTIGSSASCTNGNTDCTSNKYWGTNSSQKGRTYASQGACNVTGSAYSH